MQLRSRLLEEHFSLQIGLGHGKEEARSVDIFDWLIKSIKSVRIVGIILSNSNEIKMEGTMITETAVWLALRPGWKGIIPKIFAGKSTAHIFRLACRPSGATIEEMLRLRKDNGKPYDDRKKALVKLLKEIKNAYRVELIENGDRFQFQSEKSLVSSTNNASQQTSAQPHDNSYLPSKDDFETAYRTLANPGVTIYIDSVLDQLEINAKKNRLLLKDNWRVITEKNIEGWSKKRQ